MKKLKKANERSVSVSRHERRFGDQRHSVNVLTFHTSTLVQQAPTRHSRRKLSVYKMRVKRECERKRLDTWMEGQTIYIYIHTRNYLETGNKANNMLMLAKGLLWRKHRTTSEGRADYFGGNSELLLGKTGQWEACDKQGGKCQTSMNNGKCPDEQTTVRTRMRIVTKMIMHMRFRVE